MRNVAVGCFEMQRNCRGIYLDTVFCEYARLERHETASFKVLEWEIHRLSRYLLGVRSQRIQKRYSLFGAKRVPNASNETSLIMVMSRQSAIYSPIKYSTRVKDDT